MIFIIWILFIIADARWNAVRIKHNKKIRHGVESIIRVIVFILLFLGFHIYRLNDLQMISCSLACFFSGWLIFDIAIDGFRGLSITYLGTGSILDRLESLIPIRIATMFFKLILAAGAITAFYYGTLNPMG